MRSYHSVSRSIHPALPGDACGGGNASPPVGAGSGAEAEGWGS